METLVYLQRQGLKQNSQYNIILPPKREEIHDISYTTNDQRLTCTDQNSEGFETRNVHLIAT